MVKVFEQNLAGTHVNRPNQALRADEAKVNMDLTSEENKVAG